MKEVKSFEFICVSGGNGDGCIHGSGNINNIGVNSGNDQCVCYNNGHNTSPIEVKTPYECYEMCCPISHTSFYAGYEYIKNGTNNSNRELCKPFFPTHRAADRA